MREETRRYFGYYALAACVLLQFAGNWMLLLCGWGLGVYGASELAARGARHYGAAVAFGGAKMVLTIAGPVLTGLTGPSFGLALLLFLLEALGLLCSLLFWALACLGLSAQFREAGFGDRIEWTLLLLLAAGHLLGICILAGDLLGLLNTMTREIAWTAVNAVLPASLIGLLADLFRAQRRLAKEPGE